MSRCASRSIDRPAQQLRGPDHGRHLDGEIPFDPEAAADIGRDDADFMLGDMQRVDREPAPQIVRLLRGRMERVAVACGVVVAQIGARLDRIGRQAVVVEAELHDLRRRGHRRLGLAAVPALDLEHEIAAELCVHQRRARRDGVARGGDRGQRIVRDLHRLGRVLGGEPGVGHDRGDDIADMVDLAAREGRARRGIHGAAVAERHRMHDRELAVPGPGPIIGGQCQQHTGPRGRGPCRHRDECAHGHAGCAQRRTRRARAGRRHRRKALARGRSGHPRAAAAACRYSRRRCALRPAPCRPSARQPKTGASPPVPLRAASLRQK